MKMMTQLQHSVSDGVAVVAEDECLLSLSLMSLLIGDHCSSEDGGGFDGVLCGGGPGGELVMVVFVVAAVVVNLFSVVEKSSGDFGCCGGVGDCIVLVDGVWVL
ncbi:Hypothetical predicted protein [Olea europaea subsp. europaea]|uniref:Transmembrane protein n=1 Tax=Olea europaea subsp. europaea TaxID=158383 RepID=A0A8S0T1L3_OLEEU|nr:Hypothetical predicted protein [Olea europaea subsp. europaea]